MHAADLSFRGPVETRVSSQTAPPRYFLGRQNHEYFSRKRRGLDRKDAQAIRVAAESRPWLTLQECCQFISQAYGCGEMTVREILTNESYWDPTYQPSPRLRSPLALWQRVMLVLWLVQQDGRGLRFSK